MSVRKKQDSIKCLCTFIEARAALSKYLMLKECLKNAQPEMSVDAMKRYAAKMWKVVVKFLRSRNLLNPKKVTFNLTPKIKELSVNNSNTGNGKRDEVTASNKVKKLKKLKYNAHTQICPNRYHNIVKRNKSPDRAKTQRGRSRKRNSERSVRRKRNSSRQ